MGGLDRGSGGEGVGDLKTQLRKYLPSIGGLTNVVPMGITLFNCCRFDHLGGGNLSLV